MATVPTLTGEQVLAADLPDWRLLLTRLHARFVVDDYRTATELTARVAGVVVELDLRFGALRVVTWSHDANGVTERDVALARRVSALAAELGARAQPRTVQALEIALDTPDHAAVKPFWRAVLGMEDGPLPDDLADPATGLPGMWFQECEPEPADAPAGRMRFHLDITVPHDVALGRVDAALAAGGRLVSDAAAKAFWVLEDAEGNKACVCTWQDRG